MNVVAPSKKIAKLVDKKRLTDKFWWFKFEFAEDYPFLAGQYVSLKVDDVGARRAYSIASRPEGRVIELLVDITPDGVGTKFLLNLKVGDKVEALGPLGKFVIREDSEKEIIFLATGSGIAPMISMVEDLLVNKREGRKISLYWGLRYIRDVFGKERFERAASQYPNFSFDLVLSRPEGEWNSCKGRVGDCVKKHRTSFEGLEAYICGNPAMLEEMKSLLLEKGVMEEDIFFEKFI